MVAINGLFSALPAGGSDRSAELRRIIRKLCAGFKEIRNAMVCTLRAFPLGSDTAGWRAGSVDLMRA